MSRTYTGTPARLPDEQGLVEREGVRVHWERYGDGERAVLLLPTWSIVHSRHWKAQIAYLARHFRVVTFDGRGNGFSDRPQDASAYAAGEFVADALAVLDAAGVERACLAGISMGGLLALMLAADHPQRVAGAFVVGAALPFAVPLPPHREEIDFDAELPEYRGWQKENRHYWLRDYRGYLEFFFAQVFPEPHSTKAIEDSIAFGLDTTPETLILTASDEDTGLADSGIPDARSAEELCRRIQCPVLIVHGELDGIVSPLAGERIAELTGGELVRFEGAGHNPAARDPVRVNLLLREFVHRVLPWTPKPRVWTRAASRPRRALMVSSPIGLGHAWRDVAIADELRRRVPDLRVEWLAQEPVTTLLRRRGETIHPTSAELANEAVHVDAEAAQHRLHAFQALRRMDEILCANFMLFLDVVRDEQYDVWIGDEAWELDHYLHENPELKTAPYVWLSDFVGFLPMPEGGEREAALAADSNAEMIEHVERHPWVRDRAIFIGDADDLLEEPFGPGLPSIREWAERHYRFAGYIPGPGADAHDRRSLRAELGYGAEPLCLVSVGGSGAGEPLLQRATEALPLVRERIPELRMLAVSGPRIDPHCVPNRDGLEVVGYVHELHRQVLACDVAVVQGGLTTTMELVGAQRPFLSLPLRSHFEQRFHVRRRLDRYRAHHWMEYEDASPTALAGAIEALLGEGPSYRPIAPGGAERAAGIIAELL